MYPDNRQRSPLLEKRSNREQGQIRGGKPLLGSSRIKHDLTGRWLTIKSLPNEKPRNCQHTEDSVENSPRRAREEKEARR